MVKKTLRKSLRQVWLAIANDVRTAIASSDKIIFIPELSFIG